jgi:DNA-binding NtrC family response regulator
MPKFILSLLCPSLKTVEALKRLDSVIAFVDYEAVKAFGAKVYSSVKVACPGCNIILLSDQEHKSPIKEAIELGAYARILVPYEEWEVLAMVRNILTKRKLRQQKTC